MRILLFLSDFIVPFIIFLIICFGILKRIQVYDTFVKGARSGFLTVAGILPTLIGLMTAVGILRWLRQSPCPVRKRSFIR